MLEEIPDLNTIEVNLVQGRWHENVVPILDSFTKDPLNIHKELIKSAGVP